MASAIHDISEDDSIDGILVQVSMSTIARLGDLRLAVCVVAELLLNKDQDVAHAATFAKTSQ